MFDARLQRANLLLQLREVALQNLAPTAFPCPAASRTLSSTITGVDRGATGPSNRLAMNGYGPIYWRDETTV